MESLIKNGPVGIIFLEKLVDSASLFPRADTFDCLIALRHQFAGIWMLMMAEWHLQFQDMRRVEFILIMLIALITQFQISVIIFQSYPTLFIELCINLFLFIQGSRFLL